MKRYQRTALPQYLYVFLILLAIIGVGFLSKIVMERIRFVDYFALPWAAGRTWLLEGSNPYDPSVINIVNRSISESEYLAVLPDVETLQHPLINLIFYLPFSLLPYPLARSIWMVFQLGAFFTACYYSIRLVGWKISNLEMLGLMILSFLWLPSLLGILTGQLTLFILLISILCIYLIESEKDMTAGFLMALLVGSLPQSIFILISLIILAFAQRRWSILTSFLSGTAFLLVVTVLLLPSWFIDWLSVILDVFNSFAWVQTPLMQLASLLPGIEQFMVIFLHAVFGILLLFIWITTARKTGRVLIWNAALILVLTFILHIQINVSLLVSILLGLMLVFRFWAERWGVIGKVLSWAALLSISAGSWLPHIKSVDFTQNIPTPFLIFVLPLLVFLALLWIRWWVVKIPRLNDEF